MAEPGYMPGYVTARKYYQALTGLQGFGFSGIEEVRAELRRKVVEGLESLLAKGGKQAVLRLQEHKGPCLGGLFLEYWNDVTYLDHEAKDEFFLFLGRELYEPLTDLLFLKQLSMPFFVGYNGGEIFLEPAPELEPETI